MTHCLVCFFSETDGALSNMLKQLHVQNRIITAHFSEEGGGISTEHGFEPFIISNAKNAKT